MTAAAPERACAICHSRGRRAEHREPALEVWRCRGCGHREARHVPPARPSDYYENTPQDPRFVASLGVTRRRQARAILSLFERALGTPDGWLDFGCGRGWFLREARAAGVARLAGFDSSPLSTAALRDEGFEIARPSAADPGWPDWSSLGAAPRRLGLLDVIEHFPDEGPRRVLERLRAELPTLEAIVVKVPVAEGALFQAARALRPLAGGPYRQLFQVGTHPPHYHYFCWRSLEMLLEQSGFRLVDLWPDADVDDLFQRIPPIARWPGGAWAARAVRLFPADALVAIARRA